MSWLSWRDGIIIRTGGLRPDKDTFLIRTTFATSLISEDVKCVKLYRPKRRRDTEELVEISCLNGPRRYTVMLDIVYLKQPRLKLCDVSKAKSAYIIMGKKRKSFCWVWPEYSVKRDQQCKILSLLLYKMTEADHDSETSFNLQYN
jgi:hypothetical protein